MPLLSGIPILEMILFYLVGELLQIRIFLFRKGLSSPDWPQTPQVAENNLELSDLLTPSRVL